MARNEERTKHTLWLRAGDMDYLKTMTHFTQLDASKAIRALVARYVDNLRAKQKQATKQTENLEIDLDV